MKNKIIIALVAVVAWLGQSCETDPAFDCSYCIWERPSGWERYFVDSITDYGSP